MEREAGMALEPALYGRGFVGGRVVQYDVYLEFGGDFAVDEVEEAAELFCTVAGGHRRDDIAGGGVQSGVKVGRSAWVCSRG